MPMFEIAYIADTQQVGIKTHLSLAYTQVEADNARDAQASFEHNNPSLQVIDCVPVYDEEQERLYDEP